MRNASLPRDIDRIGSINNSVRFGIDTSSAKAFRVLSSTLYRDKVLAVVREYSCNAKDSMLMAGRGDEPFHVHLPNSLEPFFSVRDNGLGLSVEDVQKIWTNYFVSTKNSDDLTNDGNKRPTGTLGLGSKSGFAYVDSFTLISRYGGFKTTYTSFINELGIPEIVTMGDSGPTDEGNGVEVIIPVDKASDFREFHLRAAQIYELFDPMPVVTGVANFVPSALTTILTGKGWRFREGTKAARAIMGSLAYPISAYSIQNLENNLYRLLEAPVDIDFELDTLDFTAGREELSYDQNITQPALRARLKTVYAEINEMVKEQFAGCATEYEVRQQYSKFFGNNYSHLKNVVGGDVKWRDKVINGSTFDMKTTEFSNEFLFQQFSIVDAWKVGKRLRRSKSNKNAARINVSTDATFMTVILDIQTGFIPRIRNFLSNHADNHIYLISGSAADIDLAKERLDGCPFTLASSLPAPPAAPRSKSSVRMLGARNYSKNSLSYEHMSLAEASEGAYVTLTKGKVNGFETSREFFEFIDIAKGAGLFNGAIYVLSQPIVKLVKDDPSWIDIVSLIKTSVETTLRDDKDVAEALFAESIVEKMRRHNFYDFASSSHLPEGFLAEFYNHPIGHAVCGFRSAVSSANNRKIKNFVAMAKHFDLTSKSSVNGRDLVSEFTSLKVKYPLLFVIFGHRNYSLDLPALCKPTVDYIKLIDSSKDIAKAA